MRVLEMGKKRMRRWVLNDNESMHDCFRICSGVRKAAFYGVTQKSNIYFRVFLSVPSFRRVRTARLISLRKAN